MGRPPGAKAETAAVPPMGPLHYSTFDHHKPTDKQMADMAVVREAARTYASALAAKLPDGPDKTYCLRLLRTVAMWANVAITRSADGAPRSD